MEMLSLPALLIPLWLKTQALFLEGTSRFYEHFSFCSFESLLTIQLFCLVQMRLVLPPDPGKEMEESLGSREKIVILLVLCSLKLMAT
jgi:hypothetical protein